jgi:AraC family transcriptional regulator
VAVNRRALFETEGLQIGLFEARPASDACGDVERLSVNAVALPFSGVFSKHDAPSRYVIGTPSHAVFFAADTPYRIGFPGAIGDRALTFRFGNALAPKRLEASRSLGRLASQGLLPANAIMLRNLLWRRLQVNEIDELEIETLGLELLDISLRSMRTNDPAPRHAALLGRMRAVERVKEAVTLAPADNWNVTRLAKIAGMSNYHFCHVFRQLVGTSVYDYVLRERLARALDAVIERGEDLTTIALDSGFASHSHFTARFRSFFGCTPAALRRIATANRIAEIRKIMTAPRSRFALD